MRETMDKIRRRGLKGLMIGAMCMLLAGSASTALAAMDPAEGVEMEKVSACNVAAEGYDIVYVIDNSGSISAHEEWVAERDKAFRNITNLGVGSDIRVGVVYFGDHVEDADVLSLTSLKEISSVNSTDSGAGKVLNFLKKERDKANDDTNIGEGLKRACSLFEDPSREQIIVLFSDGKDDNSLKDPSQETKKQVEILEKAGIPIYCVYLENGKNDEEELKNIVDYYGDENYSEDRFVQTGDARLLSEKFVEIFYSMQNNMQYHQIRLDAYGTDLSYLPALGVKELRVFLDGSVQDQVAITSEGEASGEQWTDKSASFWVYTDPTPGTWTIQAEPAEGEQVFGTVSCATNLQTRTILRYTENGVQPEVLFYDENGESIDVDPSVNVTVVVKQGTEETAIPLTVKDGKASAEAAALPAYGDYTCEVQVQYQDYIDLQYEAGKFTLAEPASAVTEPVTEPAPAPAPKKGKAWLWILPLILILLVLLLLRKKGGSQAKKVERVEEDFSAYDRMMGDIQALYDTCTEELHRARRKQSVSKDRLAKVAEDLLQAESDLREAKRRYEVIRRNRQNPEEAGKDLKELSRAMQTLMQYLEASRKLLRP